MHPAKSVIFFTTASGAGYGMLIWLAIFAFAGMLPPDPVFGFVAFALAFALVVGGLLSSTFHLGHPERAWRAMSQWRSSWLSREGLLAVLTFIPTGLFGASWVFLGEHQGVAGWLGLLGAAMSFATVFCTAMIYASLKAVPAWSDRWTPPAYLALSLATGMVLTAALAAIFALPSLPVFFMIAVMALAAGLLVKLGYWASRRSAAPVSTAESATALGKFGTVRLIESPHSESNYLLDEMGFRVARKHADKLRRIALVFGFVLPLLLFGALLMFSLPFPALWAGLGVLSCAVGIVGERWLFFAEARHVVTLYYGEHGV